MKMSDTTLTRSDCKRDQGAVKCPNASLPGFGCRNAGPGNWIQYEQDSLCHVGRVIGRVVCESKIYIEVAVAW